MNTTDNTSDTTGTFHSTRASIFSEALTKMSSPLSSVNNSNSDLPSVTLARNNMRMITSSPSLASGSCNRMQGQFDGTSRPSFVVKPALISKKRSIVSLQQLPRSKESMFDVRNKIGQGRKSYLEHAERIVFHGNKARKVSLDHIPNVQELESLPTSTPKSRVAIDGSTTNQQLSATGVRSLQTYFDDMLKKRGYSTRKYPALTSGYHRTPSSHQKASYGIALVRAVRSGDGTTLGALLDCGLSPNPCNNFGESLLHMICRRGDANLLKVMFDSGCSVQVSDDFGRTPLHDACWTSEPCFDVVNMIIKNDERLFNVVDCRGCTPLAYVRKHHWEQWIEFLEEKKDFYWPTRAVATQGEEQQPLPPTVLVESNTIKDPEYAASEILASLVSSGQIDPREVRRIDPAKRRDFSASSLNSFNLRGSKSAKIVVSCNNHVCPSTVAITL